MSTKISKHLMESEMLRLLDSTHEAFVEDRLWEHLRSCDLCFDIYRDMTVMLGLWESGAVEYQSTDALIETGLDIMKRKRDCRKRIYFSWKVGKTDRALR
jgi:hypothetical protein